MPDPTYYQKERYFLPEHWIMEPDSLLYLDYMNYRKIILRYLPKPNKKILDVGCGDGRISADILTLENQVVGLDYSERALGFARILVPEGKFIFIDLTNKQTYPKFEEKFDAAIMVECIEHFDPKYHRQALEYIYENLNNESKFIITVPTNRVPRDPLKHYKHFELNEIRNMLEEVGFSIIDVKGVYRYGYLMKFLFLTPFINKLANNSLVSLSLINQLKVHIFNKFLANCSPKDAGRLILICRKHIEKF